MDSLLIVLNFGFILLRIIRNEYTQIFNAMVIGSIGKNRSPSPSVIHLSGVHIVGGIRASSSNRSELINIHSHDGKSYINDVRVL